MLPAKRKPEFKPNAEALKRLEQIENYTSWLDNKFRIPGTNFRFGLDPILGFLPLAGDAVSMGFQVALVSSMIKFGASRKVVILMGLNILLDFTIGSIPIIGNIFDFFFKASERNLSLLKRHYHQGKYQGSGTGVLIAIFVVFIALIALLGYLMYLLIGWVGTWF